MPFFNFPIFELKNTPAEINITKLFEIMKQREKYEKLLEPKKTPTKTCILFSFGYHNGSLCAVYIPYCTLECIYILTRRTNHVEWRASDVQHDLITQLGLTRSIGYAERKMKKRLMWRDGMGQTFSVKVKPHWTDTAMLIFKIKNCLL